jgi:hypothetical protein
LGPAASAFECADAYKQQELDVCSGFHNTYTNDLACCCILQEESIADMRGDIEAFLQDNPEILTKAKMTVGDVLHVLSLVGAADCQQAMLLRSTTAAVCSPVLLQLVCLWRRPGSTILALRHAPNSQKVSWLSLPGTDCCYHMQLLLTADRHTCV